MPWRDELVLPAQPVTLTAAQIAELERQLAAVRNDLHHYIGLIRAVLDEPAGQTPGNPETPLTASNAVVQPARQPVTLTTAQVEHLYGCLATVRHDINGQGAIIMAVLELLRLKPQDKDRLLAKLVKVPGAITEKLEEFCTAFEQAFAFNLMRPEPRALPVELKHPREASGDAPPHPPGDRRLSALMDHPAVVRECVRRFSDRFEEALQITRKPSP